MPSYQRIEVVGHTGRDAERKTLDNGQVLVKFSVAVSESWKDKSGDRQERAEWFDVSAWGKVADGICDYLTKGSLVMVEGRFQSREYDKDGQKHRRWEINANRVLLLAKPKGGQPNPQDAPSAFDSDESPF